MSRGSNASPFQTGCMVDRETPRMPTSGALTIGVNAVPPIPPRLEIVKTSEPEARKAGEIVGSVDELVAKLKEAGAV